MREFINEFGKDNFIIMLTIVGVIVLILVIILFMEKRKTNKIIKGELKNIKNSSNNEQRNTYIKQEVVTETENEPEEVLEDVETLNNDNIEEQTTTNEVYYEPNEPTREQAKEKIEEVTKRLIDDTQSDLIDHTNFEMEQEEKSIISYDELIKASHDIDEKNDKLLEDEGEVAITIEELYRKHEEEQNIIETVPDLDTKVNNPVFEDENKKFKNSEVISPVFGIYSGKLKPKTALKEIDKTVEQKDLEDEIQRTEDFLSELKRLKNKLD